MISVIINVRNEASVLPRALKSVKKFADEIIVIDMESTDNSAQVAKKYGAMVFTHKPLLYVEPARNFAISKAKHDWILILDPDEEIPESLAKKLKTISENPSADYYRVPRKNILFNKWMQHSRWWPDYNIRFFKKGKVSWNELIHTVPMTTGDGAELEASEDFAIVHHNYQTIEQFLDRLNRYTNVQSQKLFEDKKTVTWSDFLRKPADEFFSRYFFGEGYKDGIHGLGVSLLQSFSELIVVLKVWQLQGFEDKHVPLRSMIKEMRNIEKDSHYWQADARINQTRGVKVIAQRVKRKFKLP